MARPSFQFYPADWRNNAKLRRCTWAARGAWVDVMSLMNDSDEYGILRWPLKEIAQAIGCPLTLLKELVDKNVLKGTDKGESDALEYTPRSGRQAGPTVTLIHCTNGPIWYSSRMVRDEYIRQKKGNSELHKDSPHSTSKSSPMPPIGELFDDSPMPPKSDLPSSSSSSSIKNKEHSSDSDVADSKFSEFWEAWPRTDRKTAKAACLKRWQTHRLGLVAEQILTDVNRRKGTRQWLDGYEPAPLTYLNQRRWEDAASSEPDPFA
jgi:hypothetical protein